MLRVELAAARPGMKLAMPVTHPRQPSRVLLRTGFALDEEAIGRLLSLEVRSLWVAYPSLATLCRYVDEQVMRSHSRIVEQITETFEGIQRHASAKLAYHDYCKSVGALIGDLVSNPKAAIFLGELSDSGCDDLMRHSSTVTYLSLLMGLKLEGYLVRQRKHIDPIRAKEVTNLGIGAMLHDIGITALDAEIVQRYLATGNENDPAWREHPKLGYEMVRGNVEPTAANIVLHHHQRHDGSGYGGIDGQPLQGSRIHVFSRIVGLAEQFDRLRNPPGLPPQPTVWALGALQEKSMVRKFDPEVLKALFSVVPAYPPGSLVTLSNGRKAVVVDHHPCDPCRPMVQMLEGDVVDPEAPLSAPIDLSLLQTRLTITACDGHDVSDLNFMPPRFLVEEFQRALRA